MKYYKIIAKPAKDSAYISGNDFVVMVKTEDEVKKIVQEYNNNQNDYDPILRVEYFYVECSIEEYIKQQQIEIYKTSRRILMENMLLSGNISEEDKKDVLYGDYSKVLTNNIVLDILYKLTSLKDEANQQDMTIIQFIDVMYKAYTSKN